ncbi:MAG: LytTR family DNA-binding domain-containing protein [Burkholderiaceae bacterium]
MIRGADAKPLRWGLWRRHLPWHVLFSLVTSLVHVVGMVTMRKAVYALQGSSYDFGSWPKELVYEALKDVRSYAFILTIVGAYRLLLWRWQGEASLLSEPPQASRAITSSTTPASSRPMDLPMPPAPPDLQPEPAPVTPLQPQPQPQPPPQLPQVDRPERLLVKKLGKEFLLPVDEIEWVQACGNYVNLHRQQHDYPLRSSLSAFEQRLDPAQFVRVHRSYLVRLGLIASIEPTDAGDAHLHLRDGSRLPTSRTYLEALRKRLV